MITQGKPKPQALTCANCPYFQNFNEVSGRGWCDLFDQMARLQHQRTNTCEQEIETRQKEPQKTEPALQPEAESEKERGHIHGQHDAQARLHPMYTIAADEYASGYISGYNSFHSSQQAKVSQRPAPWSVTYNSKWEWYDVWVGERYVSRASTYQEGERMAQQYLAVDEMIQRQNQAVLAKYAC